MWVRHIGDAVDGVTEAALATVGLDGMDVREPLAVLHKLGWGVRPLPKGVLKGRLDEEKRMIYACLFGEETQVRSAIAHELGHVIKLQQGYRLPHCECCADRIGRAVCLGRDGIVRLLRGGTYSEVNDFVDTYSALFLRSEIQLRIHEVRRIMMREAGLLLGEGQFVDAPALCFSRWISDFDADGSGSTRAVFAPPDGSNIIRFPPAAKAWFVAHDVAVNGTIVLRYVLVALAG